jgi:hypothetical protein
MNIEMLEKRTFPSSSLGETRNEYLLHAEAEGYIFDEIVIATSKTKALSIGETRINMLIAEKKKPAEIPKESIDSYSPLQIKTAMAKIPITSDTTWDKIRDAMTATAVKVEL